MARPTMFDGTGTRPYLKPIRPIPPVYGASKCAGEQRAPPVAKNTPGQDGMALHGPQGKNFVKTILQLAVEARPASTAGVWR